MPGKQVPLGSYGASQLEDERVVVGGWEKLIEGRKTIKRERARGGEVAAMLSAGNAERFNEKSRVRRSWQHSPCRE